MNELQPLMSDKSLLITDNLEGKFFVQYQEKSLKEIDCEILTLGISDTLYADKVKSRLNNFLNCYSFINLTEFYQRAQNHTREYCLRLKFDLPRRKISNGKSLFDLLSLKEFNLWWFTTLSEMGSFRIKLIDQIYFLSLIQIIISDKKKYRNIYLDLKDYALASVLADYFQKEEIKFFVTRHHVNANINDIKNKIAEKYPLLWWIISGAKLLSYSLVKAIYLKLTNIGFKPGNSKSFFLFFSFYPPLWINTSNKSIKNLIYDNLPHQLSQEIASAYHIVFFAGIKNILKKRASVRDAFLIEKIICAERFISLKNYAYFLSFKLIRMMFNYSLFDSKKINVSYNGYDISRLIAVELNSSLGSRQLFNDILLYFAFKNILEQYKVKGVIHASEFQCYEKAIWYAARNKTKVFALQHSAIGKNWLNYYFCKDEIPSHLENKMPLEDMPLPDLYFTSGWYPHEVMLGNKIPENMLRLCGAIRYDKLASYILHKPSRIELRKKYNIPNDTKVLVVFSGVNRKESLNMISNISFALKEIDHDILVLFKSHPLRIIDEEFKKIMTINKVRVSFETIPVNANYFEYISLSDVTCFCNSTIGIESIALGTHAISFDNIHSIVSFDMIEVGNAVFHVKNPFEFKQALVKIINHHEQLMDVETFWPDAIYRTFYLLDGKSNQRFIDYLKAEVI